MSVSPLKYTNLHHSLQERVGAAGMRHVLNRYISWETLIDEARGNQVSRENKVRGKVCRIKLTYSSYVDLIKMTLSERDSKATMDTHHSEHDEDPFQALMSELNVDLVNWDKIKSIVPRHFNIGKR